MFTLKVKSIFMWCALYILFNEGIAFADWDYCSPPKFTAEEANQNFPKDNKIIQKYFHIWKKLFQDKNNLSNSEYDKHIYAFWAYGPDGKAPDNFSIHYYVNIDWFYALDMSNFIVMLSSSGDEYKYLNINRDVYLSEDEIKLFIEKTHSLEIKRVNVRQPLFFPSMKDAINKLNQIAGENVFPGRKTICTFSLTGDPLIRAKGTLNYEENRCLDGEINLRTGEGNVRKTVCYIIN